MGLERPTNDTRLKPESCSHQICNQDFPSFHPTSTHMRFLYSAQMAESLVCNGRCCVLRPWDRWVSLDPAVAMQRDASMRSFCRHGLSTGTTTGWLKHVGHLCTIMNDTCRARKKADIGISVSPRVLRGRCEVEAKYRDYIHWVIPTGLRFHVGCLGPSDPGLKSDTAASQAGKYK